VKLHRSLVSELSGRIWLTANSVLAQLGVELATIYIAAPKKEEYSDRMR